MWEAERRPTDEYRSEKSTPIFLFLQGVLLAVGRLSGDSRYLVWISI